jgi:hypothetical protein
VHSEPAAAGGVKQVKKRSIALALCCALVCSPVRATTFIGVLWPLFGPLAAPGLVEFVAELQSMSDVEVTTYLHPSWSSLVDDINRQSAGTHIIIIGYSLGANNAVLVANNTNYIDSIIALQPSMFTTNTSLTGNVGRIVEIYNPNPWMTFGGMGSQKLVGPNIEYVTNNDSHLGAPFSSEFRNLVKSEIVRLSAEPAPDTAQAKMPKTPPPAKLAKPPETSKLEVVKEERRQHLLQAQTVHVDAFPSLVNSGNSAVPR